MQFATLFCLGLIAAAVLAGPAHPQDTDNSLRLYTVHIGGSYGVYLGGGIVITAAHVVGLAPRVEIAGEDFPTKIVKRGDVNDVDLTLLSIDEQKLPASVRLHHMPLCQNPPGTGEPVIVVIPERVAQSYVMSKSLLPPDIPEKFRTVIRNVDFGNSGSGVFDAIEKCLLGIISRKISLVQMRLVNGHVVREPHDDIARYFVPVSEIAKFIPPEVRF
jgi:hypothetical protein